MDRKLCSYKPVELSRSNLITQDGMQEGLVGKGKADLDWWIWLRMERTSRPQQDMSVDNPYTGPTVERQTQTKQTKTLNRKQLEDTQ
eukprot:4035519-Amphidinium_carterae.2